MRSLSALSAPGRQFAALSAVQEEELRRSRRMKQYQEYQNMADNLEASPAVQSTGKIEGKTVKKLSNDDALGKIFSNSINKNHHK